MKPGPRLASAGATASLATAALLCGGALAGAGAQVSFDRLVNADDEPHNWFTYSGNYASHRFSALDEIHRGNVADLQVIWAYQMSGGLIETTPVVVDGVMYVTEPPSNVSALDARTGRRLWHWSAEVPASTKNIGFPRVNRGVAILDETVFVGTLDARLVALDARSGAVRWEVDVADNFLGFSITTAPLALDGKVIVGVSGAEAGANGFVDAYDPETGDLLWRTFTIPRPGEPGSETWGGDSWEHGGGSTWLTGSYDPELDLLYWPTGNPAPDWNGDLRPGDNLYTNSILALDPDTGEMQWYFQYTPHDTHDWDANQIQILVDAEWDGELRKLVVTANRNAFYYVLDRETGEFLHGVEYSKQTWAEGLDENGRPIVIPGTEPTEEGNLVWPSLQGAANWFSPSYSPDTGLFYQATRIMGAIYYKADVEYEPGQPFLGGGEQALSGDDASGAVKALDVLTGELKWEFPLLSPPWAGVMATRGGLVFGGSNEGNIFALDAETGEALWDFQAGAGVRTGPMSFEVDGEQRVATAAGGVLWVFGLPTGSAQAQSSFPPPPSVEEIDAWVEDAMARWEVPGLGLAIVYEGESYLSAGYGVRELGRDTPVDGGTLFSIGSCSKAFGAATIASLVEEGKLRWDDRITDHIPWFRLHDPWTTREIRVRDIVTHRVGTGSNQPLRPLVADRRDYLTRLPRTDPDHAFRDRYGYTNDMFVLTGHLVETVSGTDWDAYAREKLWNPLGMTTTTARMAPANASANHAEPHAIIQRRFIGNAATTGMPLEPVPWQYAEDVTVPSGGVITSADEITEWMRFHVGAHPNPPLSRSSVELMHTPHTVIRNPSGWMPFEGPGAYAMGWSTGRFGDVRGVGHGGNALGFNCSIALAPDQGFGVWATTNRNSELPWVLTKWAMARFMGTEELRNRDWHAEFERSVAEGNRRTFEAEEARQAARLDQVPSVPLEAYTGIYRNGYAGELRIRLTDEPVPPLMPAEGRLGRWDGTPGVHERPAASASEGAEGNGAANGAAGAAGEPRLVAEFDGRERPVRMPLEHWHVDRFDMWFGDVRIGVSFLLDDTARVTGVEMDYYGRFERVP